jgi:hypothetical protein
VIEDKWELHTIVLQTKNKLLAIRGENQLKMAEF